MKTISDDHMREMMGKTKEYCVVILKTGPQRHHQAAMKIIWEYAPDTSPSGRRGPSPLSARSRTGAMREV